MTVAAGIDIDPGLSTRLYALDRAVALSDGRLGSAALAPARDVLVRAGERLRFVRTHTVVALAGPTGSGKSSLFNALAELNLSRVGVERPTTAHTLACAWEPVDAQPLLDWLGIPRSRQLSRETVLDEGTQIDLHGLVLLDLPDYDSTTAEHRAEVDRLIQLVDVVVWVLDPEKYADSIAHDGYLRSLGTHAAVTICVFNQVDRLEASAVQRCIEDLRRLLTEDGMAGVEIVATSAQNGFGVTELRRLLGRRVADRRAASERLLADATAVAQDLSRQHGDGSAAMPEPAVRAALTDALCKAAGVPAAADAVADAHHQRALLASGSPLTRWLRRRRPDPLRRLRASASGANARRAGGAVRIQHTAVDAALRSFGEAAAQGLPTPWANAVRRTARAGSTELVNVLDRAFPDTDLGMRPRRWWSVFATLQWTAAAAVVGGLAWLVVLIAAAVLGADVHQSGGVAGWSWPVVLLVAGAAGSALLSVLSRPLAATGAMRARQVAEGSLRATVEQIAAQLVVEPVRAEQVRYAEAAAQFRVAAGH